MSSVSQAIFAASVMPNATEEKGSNRFQRIRRNTQFVSASEQCCARADERVSEPTKGAKVTVLNRLTP